MRLKAPPAILPGYVHKKRLWEEIEIILEESCLGCGDNVVPSEEYRTYWKETVNSVFNQVMGTQEWDYLDKMLILDLSAAPGKAVCLRAGGERYGLSNDRILKLACRTLSEAIYNTGASRGFESGFAIDQQGRFYPPREKAENICRDFFREIQKELQPYRLDVEDLSELCGMTYEKEETSANVAFFLDEDIPEGVEMCLELDDAVNNSKSGGKFFFDRTHLREIRKLLAGMPKDAFLLFTGAGDREESSYICRGYARLGKDTEIAPPICVSLQGRKGGFFYADGAPWFRLCGTRVLAPAPSYWIAQSEICRELGINAKEYEGLFKALSRQNKGAAVVFADLGIEVMDKWYRALAGYGRAWRLKERPVKNLNEDQQEEIRSLSRIDGALIVDIREGILVYAGAILDALGINEGKRERGARANSVLSHVANLVLLGGVEKRIAAAVYSEDGMVTSVLGSSYYKGKDRESRLKECGHPLIGHFREK